MIPTRLRRIALPLLVTACLWQGGLADEPKPEVPLKFGGALTGGRTEAVLSHADLEQAASVRVRVERDLELQRAASLVGVPLADLSRLAGATPGTDVLILRAADGYTSYVTQDYLERHRPMLVVRLDGQPPSRWPTTSYGAALGPYLVSHERFTPRPLLPGLPEPAAIPYAVVRVDFARSADTLHRLHVPGTATNAVLRIGQELALRSCLSCHQAGDLGGTLAGRPWIVLGAWAKADPGYFRRYVRDPKSVNPASRMSGFKDWPEEALEAVRAYFAAYQPGS
jgi:mono/diheme cytochrome c family protein